MLMDTKKIIWSIVLIVVIGGAGYLFYVQMKPFLSHPSASEVAPAPPAPGPEAAPAPAPAPAPEGAPAPAPAPEGAPAPAPK
jgi:hypothetical protein